MGSSRRIRPLRAPTRDKASEEKQVPSRLALADAAVHRILVARSLMLLRWAVGVIFVYFGALKLFPGYSPAESLVMETIKTMTFDLVPGRTGVVFTGAIECGLGVLLLTGWLRRLTI